MGTPAFALMPLEALLGAHEVVAVVTQPDKPVGRKQVLTPPPVKELATKAGVRVFQFEKIRAQGVEKLRELCPDVMVTAAYGQILSQEIIDIARYGIVNIHASLLPAYRGAMPVQWAIIKGESVSGVTTMQTDVGIDTGGILERARTEIGQNETAGELLNRLSAMGAELILSTLDGLQGGLKAVPQDESRASYYPIIKKENCLIDFSRSAFEVCNLVRALNPAPIAYTLSRGEAVKVFSARAVDMDLEQGAVKAEGGRLFVGCGSGAVEILELQQSGSVRMTAQSFINGRKTLVID